MKRTIILVEVILILACCVAGCQTSQETQGIMELLSTKLRENYGTGKNVKIAVIDSGTYDDWNNDCAFDFTSEESLVDTIDHGVPVINIISNESFGLAPDARVYSLKVINKYGNATTESILEALQWCLENQIDIINMSLSFGLFDENIECLVSELIDTGVIIVSSISNESKNVDYPSMYEGVICVGKTDSTGLYDESRSIVFSNTVTVKSLGISGNMNNYVGNSFLAPIVTGIIACVIDKSDIERRMADQILIQTVKEILLQSGIDIK